MTDIYTLGIKADTTDIDRGKKSLDNFSGASTKAEGNTEKLTKSVKNYTVQQVKAVAVTALAGVGLTRLTQSVIGYSDASTLIDSQVRQVVDSELELIKTRERLTELSKETRSTLAGTVGIYTELTRSTSELNISSDRLFEVTKTLNNLFTAGGKPISEVAGAIKQLNQGFAAGVLRGDEFNSVAEGAPRIMDALAVSLGKTRGELREFAATGGITSEIMITAIEAYSTQAQTMADQTEKTFAQSIQNVQTNVIAFIGEADSLNEAVTGAGNTIESLSENLDALGNAALTLGAIYTASLLPGFAKSAAALVAETIALRAASIASLEKAKSSAAVAAADLAVIQSASAKTAGFVLNTSAMSALTAAEVRHTAAASAVAVAQSQVATTATLAGTAINFMLGPIGLLIIGLSAAAAVFTLTKEASEDAEKQHKDHADTISNLASEYEKLSNAAFSAAYIAAQREAMQVDAERIEVLKKKADVEAQILATINNGASSSEIIGYLSQIQDLDKQVSNLDLSAESSADKLKAMQEVFQSGLPKLSAYTDGLKLSSDVSDSTNDSFEALTLKIETMRMELGLTSDELELFRMKQQAIAFGATPEMLQALESQVLGFQTLRNELKEANEQELNFEQLTADVDDFGGAWTRTGSSVVNAFGDISDALGDYMGRMSGLGDLQKRIDTEREAGTVSSIELDKLQQKVNEGSVSAQLSGIGALSKAGGSLFAEKTAAAKSFAALSQIIAVAELAISIQKMTAGTTEAGVHVANETTKQGANALTAITSAFAAPFPVNFIAGAAMVGIMSSLLGGFSGGGGASFDPTDDRQEGQGTGSVLGSSDKSGSINKSQERFEDIAIDQLSELRGIRGSLNNIGSGIAQLGKGLVTSNVGDFGGFTGKISGSLGFSSTRTDLLDSGVSFIKQTFEDIIDQGFVDVQQYFDTKTKKKSWWGLSSSTSFDTAFEAIGGGVNEQIAAIFKDIGSTVLQAATALGFETTSVTTSSITQSFEDFDREGLRFGSFRFFEAIFTTTEESLEDALQMFSVDIGKISFEGLSGEEIQAELEAVFSQQADLIAEYLVPSIAEFQNVGEGLFDTLLRVTQEQVVFNDALSNMGVSLADLGNVLQIEIAQGIISLVGGAERFADLTQSFFSDFFSEAEQFDILTGSITDVFGDLGVALSDNREAFRELVEGQDLTTEAGRQLFATLLEIAPAMDSYFDTLEERAAEELALAERTASDKARLDEKAANDALRLAERTANELLREQERAAQESVRVANEQSNLTIRLLGLQGESELALAMSRDMQLAAIDESLRPLLELIFAEEDLARIREESEEAAQEAIRLAGERAGLNITLLGLQGKAEEALILIREREMEATTESLRPLLELIFAEEDLIAARNLAEQASIEAAEAEDLKVKAAEESASEILRIQEDAYQAAIKIENDRTSLTIKLLDLQGESEQALSLIRERELANTNDALKPLLELIFSEEDLIKSRELSEIAANELEAANLTAAKAAQDLADATIKQAEAAEAARQDLANAAFTMLNKAIDLEKQRLQAVLDVSREAYNAELSRLTGLRDSLNAEKSARETNLANSTAALTASFDAEINAINATKDARINSLNTERSAVASNMQMLLGLANRFSQKITDTSTLDQALAAAKRGDFSVAEQLQVQEIDSGGFGSASDFNVAQALQANKLQSLSGLASNAAGQAGNKLSGIDRQIASAERSAVMQIGLLETQRDALLNIDTTVLPLSESIQQYQDSQLALTELAYDDEISKLDMLVESNQEVYDLHENSYNEQIQSLAEIAEASEDQLNTLLNIDSSVLSVSDAIAALAQVPALNNNTDETSAELVRLAQENKDAQAAIAKSSAATAAILQRLELGGLDTRTIT